MKNEKLFKVLDVVVKVASLVATVAQIVANTFKAQQTVSGISQEDAHMIKDFMNEDIK